MKAAGTQDLASAGADCSSTCGCSPGALPAPSLWIPGSVLWNMLPSPRARELQQIGLEAKYVPKGSFTTAEGSCFKKDVQDKKTWLFQETLEPSKICFPF